MRYDWKKIFENKTNKELYEIYSGNSFLPSEAAEYARQELERRNFDFNDTEANKTAWRLADLLLEAERLQQVLKENRKKIIPYKSLYFIIPGILIVYIVLLKVLNINLTIFFPVLMIVFTLWYVSLTNRVYAKQREKQNNILEKIIELKEKLENNLPVDKLNPIKKDISRNIKEYNKSKKALNYILIAIFLIFLLINIIRLLKYIYTLQEW